MGTFVAVLLVAVIVESQISGADTIDVYFAFTYSPISERRWWGEGLVPFHAARDLGQ